MSGVLVCVCGGGAGGVIRTSAILNAKNYFSSDVLNLFFFVSNACCKIYEVTGDTRFFLGEKMNYLRRNQKRSQKTCQLIIFVFVAVLFKVLSG